MDYEKNFYRVLWATPFVSLSNISFGQVYTVITYVLVVVLGFWPCFGFLGPGETKTAKNEGLAKSESKVGEEGYTYQETNGHISQGVSGYLGNQEYQKYRIENLARRLSRRLVLQKEVGPNQWRYIYIIMFLH